MLRAIEHLRSINNTYKLYIDKSTIPEAGKGLFVGVDIKKGTYITRYGGKQISWEEATQLRKKGLHTHCKSIYFMGPVIDGFKGTDENIDPGWMASLTNDARDSKRNNTVFATRRKEENIIWIRAKQDISAGSELFVSYGNTYWK